MYNTVRVVSRPARGPILTLVYHAWLLGCLRSCDSGDDGGASSLVIRAGRDSGLCCVNGVGDVAGRWRRPHSHFSRAYGDTDGGDAHDRRAASCVSARRCLYVGRRPSELLVAGLPQFPCQGVTHRHGLRTPSAAGGDAQAVWGPPAGTATTASRHHGKLVGREGFDGRRTSTHGAAAAAAAAEAAVAAAATSRPLTSGEVGGRCRPGIRRSRARGQLAHACARTSNTRQGESSERGWWASEHVRSIIAILPTENPESTAPKIVRSSFSILSPPCNCSRGRQERLSPSLGPL